MKAFRILLVASEARPSLARMPGEGARLLFLAEGNPKEEEVQVKVFRQMPVLSPTCSLTHHT